MSTVTTTRNEGAVHRSHYHEADVVVVGAGVFGCAAAYALAEQGRSVLLLERWMKEPDRIVGELLQPGGVHALRKLGLGHCLQGIDAIPCYGYDVINRGEDVIITYPETEGHLGFEDTASPKSFRLGLTAHKEDGPGTTSRAHAGPRPSPSRPVGCSFHHGRFIMQLRRSCLQHPNITMVETEAKTTIKGERNPDILGVEARTVNPSTGKKEPDFFFGQLTIIADGYDSKFRKQYIPQTPNVKSRFYALELIDCPLPNYGYGHVVIGDASPILLYQIGTHETRALIDVPDKCPDAAPAVGGVRNYIDKIVLPSLPPAVQPCFRAALDKGPKIPRSMPNSWLPPSKQGRNPGMVILGDAMNMRHPLTGGGMTVALNDVLILSDVLSPSRVPSLNDTWAVRKAMAELHSRRKSLTSIVNVLAQALYSLFSAADPNLAKLQRGCFAYFKKGVTDQPVALLGGLIHDPLVLFRHFFTVAFLAIWIDAQEYGVWNVPLLLWNAISILWTASVVFLPVMAQEAF